MGTPRIPRTINGFNTFIIGTNTYFLAGTPTNATRLGILPAEMTQWTLFATQWTPLFVKYSDKKGSRTTVITEQLHLIINQCKAFDKLNHILDRIAASPTVTILDMETFNIKKGVLQSDTRTVRRTASSELVMAGLKCIGGGSISIKCHSTHDSGRPSVPAGSNCVQYAYQIGGETPISADSDSLKLGLSTQASFTLITGASSTAKTLYIFFRWHNTKHPELSGPWSSMQSTLIL